jgi:2-dehydro-3-deoxy-D-arabinonate dehydratase
MVLAKHVDANGQSNWYWGGRPLPASISLSDLLGMSSKSMTDFLRSYPQRTEFNGQPIAPVEADHEVWACGVTYLRSRDARESESTVADVYARVYHADRPEVFFKSTGKRVVGPGGSIRIRKDSDWNVPEPELTLVVNSHLEIVGYTVGNDVSSRSIEGENPLYLPQAKTYDGACALGPGIVVANADEMRDLEIGLIIRRNGQVEFEGTARTSQMKRSFEDLVDHVGRETSFPSGVFIMTGTGIVPDPPFTLNFGDTVEISIGTLTLRNTVA